MTQTMEAIAVTPRQPASARLVQLPQPQPDSGTVHVRVLDVGIDGTDTEIDKGEYGDAPAGEALLVIGHEAIGRADAIGQGVSGLQGDLVVATVRRPDDCPNCRAGESDMCLWGNYTERGIKGAHGYMAQYYADSPAVMVKIPESLRSFAVLLEPLSILEKATFQAWKIQERMIWESHRAVVLGAGPIGLLATILLRLRGLEVHVYATTPPGDYRSRLIESMGAVYNNVQAHPIAYLKDRLGQIDFILEATGVSSVRPWTAGRRTSRPC